MKTLQQLYSTAGGPILAVSSQGIYFLCQTPAQSYFQGIRMEPDPAVPGAFVAAGMCLFPGLDAVWEAV